MEQAWRKRLVRFLTVGALCTLLQESLLVALVHLSIASTLANAIGFGCGAQLSFVLNSRFTWHDRRTPGTSTALRWLSFNLVACFALTASTLGFVGAKSIGIWYIPASLVGVMVGTVVTFVINNLVTFRARMEHASLPEREAPNPGIDLSIIVPAYQEASRIGTTLDSLAAHLAENDYGVVEVVVVSADSPDGTAAIAASRAHLFECFVLVHAGPKVGKGRDVGLGMLKSSGRYRLFMDADLATPLRHLASVKSFMQLGGTVGVGVRNVGSYHNTFTRNLLSRITSLVTRTLIAPDVADTQCGFKVFEGTLAVELFSRMRLLQWNFDMEILALARTLGHKITTFEIPDWTDPKPEEEGLVGDSRLAAILRGAIDPFKVRFSILTGRHFASHGPVLEYAAMVDTRP